MAKRPRKAKLLEDQYPTHYLPNVGRQVMADGGVPEDTQRAHDFVQEQLYGDAYRPSPVVEKYAAPTAAQALEINRDRPASSASEFVRHQLSKDEPQLPQYDRENVQAWKEGAKELGHLAAYGIPYVGEGLMAYDLANAAKSLARPGASSEDRAIDLVNAGLALPGMGRAAKAAAVAGAALAPEEAQAGVVDRALKAIRAYHGSPHKFDRFDISKIGTGEGAQAYGHGLYFAENPEVAHAYREALSPYGRGDRPEDIAARVLHATRGDRDAALDELRNRADTSLKAGGSYEGAQRLMQARNILNTNPEVAGHMYEVDIHANPEHLLDWDKPIADQPHVVRGLNQYVDEMGGEQALKHFSKELEDKRRAEEESFARLWEDDQPLDLSDMMTYFNKNKYSSKEALTDLLSNINKGEETKGADFYRSLSPQEYDYKGATETAQRLGIPGLQYFDRLSRGAGSGSRNYVIFDPNLVDITRRYAKGGDVEGYDKGGAIAKVLGKLMAPGSGYAPRKGFPELVNLPGIGKVESRPIPEIESIARRFAGEAHDADVTPLNPEFSKRVAQEYDVMRHDPQDPIVKRAFQALADETMQQYRAAKDLGLDIKFLKPGQADPYAASPALGYEDIVNRGRLFVYPTEAGFGSTGGINASNVLLKGAGRIGDKEDAVVNDAFRVIHDLYGHFGPGNPFFRAPGEERAFQLHKRMFSPEARPALTSETRGQNSWVNFGDMAERNRAAKGADTYYADQKTGIMPKWTMEEPPAEGVNVDEYIRSLPHKDKGGAIAKALQAASRIIAPSEKMGVIHGVDSNLLPRLKELGGLPSPSLAITKPLLDNANFGNVTFVGRKHLAEPSFENPIFGQDAYTPRFPYIEGKKEGTFYSEARDKVVPVTLENVLEHMTSRPIIGGEYWRVDNPDRTKELGVIMAEQAPAFKSLEEIKRARDNIVPMHEWKEHAQDLESEHDRLADILHRYANEKSPYDTSNPQGYFGEALGSRNQDDWRYFYPEAPQEDIDAAISHLANIRKMPALYFEGKPQRAVGFDEFAGAVVPETIYKDVSPILRDMGVKDVSTYAAPFERRGERVTKDFGEHMFADGGPVKNIPRADDEQFFRRLALWTYSVAPLFSNTHQLSQNRLGYDKGGVIAKAIKAAANIAKEEPSAPAIIRPLDELFPGASRRYAVPGEPVPAIDKVTGKPYLEKTLSPEGELVLKARQAAQKAINKGDFKPYFDPRERFDVDVGNYAPYQSTLDIRRVQPATQEKYDALARSPVALERLGTAYQQGLGQAADAGNWYHMGQLEKQFVDAYGSERGRELFKERFADAMAATTGGADPTTNLMMAHYGNYLKNRGETIPETTYNFPFPIGGRFAGSNMDQYRKMILEGQGIGHDNPKRYNFAYNFLGEPRGATLDEQMSNIFDPKMNMPPTGTYGHYEGALHDLARKYGVDPRYFQEVAWAGGKDLKAIEKNKPRYKAQPMIQNVNEAIERTSRITGLPHRDVVERGLVRAEMPLYQDGGAVIKRALDVVSNLPHARA